jgi:protease-4
MKQFLITLAGVFAGLILFFVGVPFLVIASIAGSAKPAPPPARAILTLDLRQPLADQEAQNPLAFLGGGGLSVVSTVETLRHAQGDSRVKGLLIRLPEGGLSPAAADEIAVAVRAFRTSGKPVIAHSQGIYPSGVSTAAYMLGAASGQFWMQPGASLQSVGLSNQEMFFKRAFDKYGVKADYEQRYQYKNAVNPYLYDDFTPAHREAELGWMTSIYDTELIEAATDRKLDPARLKATLEGGPYSAEDAAARGLIDRVGQEHDAEAALKSQADVGAKFVDMAAYRTALQNGVSTVGGDAVAVIGAEGDIVTGASRGTGFGSSSSIYSDDVAKAFYDAIDDKDVKAIVFRVSSPGGSDTASEQILAALEAAKAAGKPVVVSMGTYAASGGYWISSQASEIVAEPTTLTGSIGVFGGKFVTGPALARFGIDTHALSVGGDYASAFGSDQPFTPSQRAQFSGWMDRIYAGFVKRVAAGRHLSPDRVQEIAKGRVWTGVQAKQLGLVDKLGGFYEAVADAKRLGGLPSDRPVILKRFPGRKSAFDLFQHAMGVSAVSIRTLAAAAWILGDPRAQSLMDDMMRARAGVQGSTVMAPNTVR